MAKHSAGILLYRLPKAELVLGFSQPSPLPQPSYEFLLVHPGGPFWAGKDEHAWSIPKGNVEEEGHTGKAGKAGEAGRIEKMVTAARREFQEETGMSYEGIITPLPPVKTSGKFIHAFLGEGDFDVSAIKSNDFEMEWPPKSGKMQSFHEVDNAAWFDAETAKKKIHKGQIGLIDSAMTILLGT